MASIDVIFVKAEIQPLSFIFLIQLFLWMKQLQYVSFYRSFSKFIWPGYLQVTWKLLAWPAGSPLVMLRSRMLVSARPCALLAHRSVALIHDISLVLLLCRQQQCRISLWLLTYGLCNRFYADCWWPMQKQPFSGMELPLNCESVQSIKRWTNGVYHQQLSLSWICNVRLSNDGLLTLQ